MDGSHRKHAVRFWASVKCRAAELLRVEPDVVRPGEDYALTDGGLASWCCRQSVPRLRGLTLAAAYVMRSDSGEPTKIRLTAMRTCWKRCARRSLPPAAH